MMKEQSAHSAVVDTVIGSVEPRSIPKQLTGILDGLLARSHDPLDDEIIELARAIENVCRRMETVAREMRTIGSAAARIIEERERAGETQGTRRTGEPARPGARISIREREVLMHLIGGKSNREISRELGISEKTVKNHLWKLYRKIGVNNRTQLFHQLICT
jgi:DNA-binding NarL/FixJ family response regulator